MIFDECYGKHCRAKARDSSHPHVEHIVWDKTILSGTYKVWVVNHDGFEDTFFKILFEHPNSEQKIKYGHVKAKEGAKSKVFKFTIKPHQVDCKKDSDGDGLCDKWEIEGLDVDGDGTIDLDLKAMGANPMYKDIFVEYDWTPGHKPSAFQLKKVAAAFAKSNERNPNGRTGIRLHILQSEEVKTMGGTALGKKVGLGLADVNRIKFNGKGFACGTGAWFGSAKDRAHKNCENISKAREKVFHYSVFTYKVSTFDASGIADLPGNDFIVAIDQLMDEKNRGKGMWERATFMHELGHNLGLHHGGKDDVNCKTNYLSVMNYLFQTNLNYRGRPLDYSRNGLPSLEEFKLNEAKGIQGSGTWKQVIWGIGGTAMFGAPANKPQDWNQNKKIGPTESIDLNFLPPLCRAENLDTLEGNLDWGRLVFDFRKTGHYEGAGALPGEGDVHEGSE